jgi:hypothetical protein
MCSKLKDFIICVILSKKFYTIIGQDINRFIAMNIWITQDAVRHYRVSVSHNNISGEHYSLSVTFWETRNYAYWKVEVMLKCNQCKITEN